MDIELLLPAFSTERIFSFDDLIDVASDAELQEILLDVLQAQLTSRGATRRIERALKELPSDPALPGSMTGVQAFSTPPHVPVLDDGERPPPPPHAHKPALPDRPARATRRLTFEPLG
eukprot:7347117-Prymnesium_polylepis.1